MGIRAKCAAAGISYTRTKWKPFWGYFRATGIEHYNIESWNVHGLHNSLVTQTSNPLERFHRELNRWFPTSYSSITTFVSVIRAISQSYVDKLGYVAQGCQKRGNRRRTNTRKERRRNAGSDSSNQVEETIDLTIAVGFTEEDAASNSKSQMEWNSTGESSESNKGEDNETNAEMDLEYSFKPGEYCDDTDDGDTTSDARDETVVKLLAQDQLY
ncbi:hypothetical protein PR003_g1559 [Phytophthora rubi]|uniref:Uncharacterized protein n=1 Tax=Phytophthora rubi TaxID=129364 RepID=A0A6A3NPE2_9STRA|nr:hypothetical protein PR002_g9695 [Phytophthora rubi]KAE9043502.1 hypothetical protein PR001_g5768 [Phytophthora rubi]KAE9357883.1 hypothetical protein PR003_g1559 [Phytophthora rubi]